MSEPSVAITHVARRNNGQGDELHVEYTASNLTWRKILIANRIENRHWIFRVPPGEDFSTELAHVFFDQDETALFLLGVFPRPGHSPLESYYGPAMPRGTLVPRRSVVKATIRQPLPLIEWHPYDAGTRGEPVEPTRISRVRLVLHYAFSYDLSSGFKEVPDTRGSYYFTAYWQQRKLEHSATLPEPCTLLRRTDDFTRPR